MPQAHYLRKAGECRDFLHEYQRRLNTPSFRYRTHEMETKTEDAENRSTAVLDFLLAKSDVFRKLRELQDEVRTQARNVA